ncbi:phytoene desaturase family protein [Desulfosediminicola flagellatus]|uniref:phytoene desaturase family protein n=1 Tax=Desulfosediminicola flagellatus TaxID=2569541 RepID=UPI0010AC994C|nr:NAD(P)/FAD-dependent oxidoreductase [Desulfosediminicola flagellatus]
MNADVVIVGSGIAGLTAGAILSKNGKKVVIVEKQPAPGGALRQFRRNRISFDVGFHYTGGLGSGEILDIIWKYCDVLPKLSVLPLTPGGYDHFEFFKTSQPIHGYFSYERFAEELKTLFPAEKQGIDVYFSTIRQICNDVPFYKTDLPLTPFLRGYKSNPRSLAEFLDSHLKDPRLKSVLAAPAFLYGVPIQQASLEIHALVAHGYYSGAYTVAGGGQAIVDAFISTLERNGVQLITDAHVTSLQSANGAVTGVNIEGHEEIFCDQVIYTGHPATMVEMVPQSVFRPAYKTRLRELENSLSMFAVFCKGEHSLNGSEGPANYYLLPDEGDVLPKDANTPHNLRPMMMTGSQGHPCDPLQQDQNGIILLRLGYWKDTERFAAAGTDRRSPEYADFKMSVGREMIAKAEQRWGDICGHLEPLAVGTPLTFRDELVAPNGCAYGAMHCLGQYNPDVRTRMPGLYLSGQSTLMTGVVGSSISGLVGAGEILGLESLWNGVTK